MSLNNGVKQNTWLRSSVFKWSLITGLVFVASGALIGFSRAQLAFYMAEKDARETLAEETEGLLELVREEQLAVVLEDFAEEEEEMIWEADRLYDVYHEEEMAFRVSNTQNETLYGLASLTNEPGWHQTILEEDMPRPLYSLVTDLDDGHRLTVSVFMLEEQYAAVYFFHDSLFWLLIIVMPFSTLISFILYKRLCHQFANWTETMDLVGQGELDQRVEQQNNHDEFGQVALQLNHMLDQIQHLNQNIKNVSVGIAHDLKTPISHLSGRLQLLAQEVTDHPKASEHINVAEQQIDNIMRTFEALLRLTEIETGARRKQFKTFDLSELLDDLVDGYEPLYKDSGRALDVSIVPGIVLHGDADLMAQMVSNLLENILEHANPKGHAWLRLQASKQGAVLQIGDDGPGIPQTHHQKIFDRFFRMDSSRNSPGNGLGLALVKSICQLHEAEINLLPNQTGSVFDIHFKQTPPNHSS